MRNTDRLAYWPMLAARAHWLLPLLLVLAIVILKDWPPPSCEGKK